ncbi:hypothetical protein O181_001884 [Austropuccinia psidii MF-1]|uniref:Uncharacterized protein n=1 Tax=Austropuccinia psidii MF-1 TaxID=1389203 RepID=A0A9Q3BBE6_9BASI|nr:hypothetical protein [Austropuccinia psidii MF-1]
MADQSPDSQFSGNESFERLVAHEDQNDSSQIEATPGNEANDLYTQSTSLCEEGTIQTSSQKRKRRTREEATIHQQEVEAQQKEKRQTKMNECITAEASQIQKSAHQLAQ